MKNICILSFCLFLVVGCRQVGIDEIEPIAPSFKNTCLLSKIQHSYTDNAGRSVSDYTHTYRYDSLRRIAEYTFLYKGGSDTLRYEYSFKDVYQYNSSGFLVQISTSGLFYNGNAKYYGNKPSPIAPITGKTTFTYQNGLLVKEEKYQKMDAQFVVEFINPRTDIKSYEYDSQGKLIKYINENADANKVSYFLNNGRITKSETEWYDLNAQKLIINNSFTQWGLLSQRNWAKQYYKDGYPNITAEVGNYDKNSYDTYGRKIKIEEYRQDESRDVNGNLTGSNDAVLVRSTEYKYEDTALPISTLPIPKGHPQMPDFEGDKTYNLRSKTSTILKSANFSVPFKNADDIYSYEYNTEKLPTNVTITSNSYDNKGNIQPLNKGTYRYEYVGCK